MSTLWRMDDPAANQGTPDRPGEPLDSGFTFRPASEVPEAQLSPAARARVVAKIENVDDARLRAAQDGHTSYVG